MTQSKYEQYFIYSCYAPYFGANPSIKAISFSKCPHWTTPSEQLLIKFWRVSIKSQFDERVNAFWNLNASQYLSSDGETIAPSKYFADDVTRWLFILPSKLAFVDSSLWFSTVIIIWLSCEEYIFISCSMEFSVKLLSSIKAMSASVTSMFWQNLILIWGYLDNEKRSTRSKGVTLF